MRKSDLRQDFTQVLTSPPLSDTTLIMNRMQTILTFAVAFVAIAAVNSAAVDGSEHHSSQDRVLHGQPLSRDGRLTKLTVNSTRSSSKKGGP